MIHGQTAAAGRYRWVVLAIFVLSSAINYLDRQALATLAPLVRAEFQLSNAQYGLILSAFSLTYAAGAPFAGALIDRAGLNRAISLAVALWSAAGIATGFSSGLNGLVGCRALLGAAEAAGIPAAGKAIHLYLRPAERALGNAMNQAGISLGLMLAPPLATWLAVRHGWREAFVVTGVLGLLWIPLWHWASQRAPAAPLPKLEGGAGAALLRDRRLWGFVAANALAMIGYSLWTNWTTLYLVEVHRLTLVEAAWYAWIPPLFATLGGAAGGWMSMRLTERGVPALDARLRACVAAAVVALGGAPIPLAPSAGWACGRHLAEHLRGGGLQRKSVYHASRRFRRGARRVRGVDSGGVVRRGAGGGLAGIRQSDRQLRLCAAVRRGRARSAGRLRSAPVDPMTRLRAFLEFAGKRRRKSAGSVRHVARQRRRRGALPAPRSARECPCGCSLQRLRRRRPRACARA